MKRFMLAMALMAVTVGAFAQGVFTIRRPLDGSIVRETVDVRIPKSSISDTGFVGIWINGRFIEAVAVVDGYNTQGNDFVYKIDTKKMGLADGKLSIEAVLYADAGSANRILNKSSVQVTLDNRSSIRTPAGGFKLRYNLTPGREMTYGVEMRQSVQMLTASDTGTGRTNELASEAEKFRYRYTVMNAFKRPDGRNEGVILLQPMTPKGQDHVFLTAQGESSPKKYFDYNMAPLYMRIDDTGREVWGSLPSYSGFEGAAGDPSRLDLYALLPLPVLPTRSVTLGGPPLPGFVSQGTLDLDKRDELEKFTTNQPASGRVEGIEWERGLRCVRIKNAIQVGNTSASLIGYEENYWFAIDLGTIIRLDRKFTITTRVNVPSGGGGAASGGNGGGGGAGQEGGTKRGLSTGGRWNTPPFNEPGIRDSLVDGSLFQNTPGGRRRLSNSQNPSGGTGGAGRTGGGSGGGGRTRQVRQTIQYTLIAE